MNARVFVAIAAAIAVFYGIAFLLIPNFLHLQLLPPNELH
jgi:hypothetical protein